MADSASVNETAGAPPAGPQASGYSWYVLFVLVVVYILNFIDRQIVNILQEDIKHDLNLLDWQLGTMTGLAFATVYCTVGIPVARIADSTSRKGVVAVSLAVWSAFTALCGLATNFITLLGARMGVGLGEAGGSPPAHAMISDLYEKEKRGRALAIYSAGLYAGTLAGYYLGGVLSDSMSWREAFFVVGDSALLALQLRDAEVQQQRPALGRDHHVRRLQVAVHHQLAVRGSHRVADHQHQVEHAVDAARALPAPGVDGHAVDGAQNVGDADERIEAAEVEPHQRLHDQNRREQPDGDPRALIGVGQLTRK